MTKHIFKVKAKVIKNIVVREKYYKILLLCPDVARQAQPGQFVMIKVGEQREPLLRRPFSIHKVEGRRPKVEGQVEILYEVVGEGSRLLSEKRKGEYLDLIGPLGNGFTSPLPPPPSHPILVAGGMGVAPLLFLAEKLVTRHKTPSAEGRQVTSKILVLIGVKTKSQLLCADEFRKLGCAVKIATDDGSRGFKGKATDLLKLILRTTNPVCPAGRDERRTTIYACGPTPMLKAVSALSRQYNIPAQISLEAHMACGIGACLGCAVKVRGQGTGDRGQAGYKMACKDGPVFQAKEIIWE